jgi:hypothetical protein
MTELSGVVSRSIVKARLWILGVLLAALIPGAVQAPAQQSSSGSPAGASKTFSLSANVDTYSDAASTSCEKGNTSPYAGMDPLACYGVMAPTDSAGQCSLSGMTVFKKVGGTCYYCQPIVPPTPGILVPMDDLGAADEQGYKCGVDQADPSCMAVCTRQSGSGPFLPPPGTTLASGPKPAPGPPSPGPEPRPAPTTPPPANRPGPPLSGTVGSGTPCQPFGPGGYDYCANPAGTQPAGCVCSAPGAKGITRVRSKPQPAPSPSTPPNMAAVDSAMNACLAKVVPYWRAQSVQPADLTAASKYVGDNNATPIAPTIREELAMALQAQTAHETQYGAKNTYSEADATDYMVGWLDHCLYTAKLVPQSTNMSANDPRLLYSQFLGVPESDRRIGLFNEGWEDDTLAPLPMLPPGKTVF